MTLPALAALVEGQCRVCSSGVNPHLCSMQHGVCPLGQSDLWWLSVYSQSDGLCFNSSFLLQPWSWEISLSEIGFNHYITNNYGDEFFYHKNVMKLFQMSEGRKTEIVLLDGRKFCMLIQVLLFTPSQLCLLLFLFHKLDCISAMWWVPTVPMSAEKLTDWFVDC